MFKSWSIEHIHGMALGLTPLSDNAPSNDKQSRYEHNWLMRRRQKVKAVRVPLISICSEKKTGSLMSVFSNLAQVTWTFPSPDWDWVAWGQNEPNKRKKRLISFRGWKKSAMSVGVWIQAPNANRKHNKQKRIIRPMGKQVIRNLVEVVIRYRPYFCRDHVI